MTEPITISTTAALIMSLSGAVLAASSPATVATDLAALFMGMVGALVWQGKTKHLRHPNNSVMLADVVVGIIAGFSTKVLGMPFVVAVLNRYVLPQEAQLAFKPTDDLRWIVLFASIAGFMSSPVLRWLLDKFMPGWDKDDGRQT